MNLPVINLLCNEFTDDKFTPDEFAKMNKPGIQGFYLLDLKIHQNSILFIYFNKN